MGGWLRRLTERGDRARRSGQPTDLGPAAHLDPGSRFSFVESLEFWPELDDDLASFTARPTYPGNDQGTVRGEWGEFIEGLGLVTAFHLDRHAGTATWAGDLRYEGQEVHDLHWAGSVGSGRATLAGSPLGVDRSPDGRSIAHLSWVDGKGKLTVIDARSGTMVELAAFDRDQISGSETVRWSPDSRLVLVTGNTARPSLLLDVATARLIQLPRAGQSAWWPAKTSSSLLLAELPGTDTVLSHLDLATGEVEPIGQLRAPEGLPRHQDGVLAFDLEIAADGSRFVARTFFGSASYLGVPVGGRTKWVEGSLPLTPDAGPPTIERWSAAWNWQDVPALELVHKDVRWTERLTTPEIDIHPSLLG